MKILIVGYGKMGKAIESLVKERFPQHTIVACYGYDKMTSVTEKPDVDVAIEFSNPDSAATNYKKLLDWGIPIVSGTTGWLHAQDALNKYCNQVSGTFLYASNFSIGVNLFFEVNKRLAELMNKFAEYQPMIHEIHHKEKKDSPSGTAISIGKEIVSTLDRKESWVNHSSTNPSDLSILSFREENVPGTHIVDYRSTIDSITLSHIAQSREGFALGAIKAAEWVIGKKGIFSMKDVLEF